MADTIRQKLVDAVILALQQISTANGYVTDIGATVEDWPSNVQGTYDQNELPIVGVFDVDSATSRENLNARTVDRTLTVQVRAYIKKDTPSRELRAILGDLETAIGVDPTWGKLALGTMPAREGVVIQSDDFEISACAVEFTIHYNTCAFNPY